MRTRRGGQTIVCFVLLIAVAVVAASWCWLELEKIVDLDQNSPPVRAPTSRAAPTSRQAVDEGSPRR